MIDFVEGELAHWEASRLVISMHGLGMSVLVSAKTAEKFSGHKGTIRLDTYLNVREDALELYGFSSIMEREVFMRLISVSGIGPKLALRILSSVPPSEMIEKIRSGNIQGLTAIKGIGKKTAEVLVANLRTPFQKLSITSSSDVSNTSSENQNFVETPDFANDAIKALCALGLREIEAEKAVQKAMAQHPESMNTSVLVSLALKMV